MRKLLPLLILLFAFEAHSNEIIVMENVEWLYLNKERSLSAVRDRNDPNSLMVTNLVFSTWAMADASINAEVAPFMAELWISRLKDVLLWFQNNHNSSFERWLRIQEHMLFQAESENDVEELKQLQKRLINHLQKYESKSGIYWKPVGRYLEVLRKIQIKSFR